jgi:molybdate-binding protein
MIVLKNVASGLYFSFMADDTSLEGATKIHASKRDIAVSIAQGRAEAGLGVYELVLFDLIQE